MDATDHCAEHFEPRCQHTDKPALRVKGSGCRGCRELCSGRPAEMEKKGCSNRSQTPPVPSVHHQRGIKLPGHDHPLEKSRLRSGSKDGRCHRPGSCCENYVIPFTPWR